jgi:hypothetical protein
VNVTLSIDDQTLARARLFAQQRGTSVNQMIRDFLEGLTGGGSDRDLAELEHVWREEEGDSGGRKWNREELYDRPVLR